MQLPVNIHVSTKVIVLDEADVNDPLHVFPAAVSKQVPPQANVPVPVIVMPDSNVRLPPVAMVS